MGSTCHRCGADADPARPTCPTCGTPLTEPTGAFTFDATSEERLEAPASERVGRYVLVRILGRGGMGVVHEAWDPDLGRSVALKLLLGGRWAQRSEAERFLREARAVGRLDHPGIVRVHDLGWHEDRAFFTMDLHPGRSLRDRLREGPVPTADAAKLVAAVARALHHAHERGLVHRDVKPENLLLTADGRPVVTDFGIARDLGTSDEHRLTATGAVLGTPAYMAPEQARGQADRIGPATDVYALGAVLYELLVGRAPYSADSPATILLQVLAGPPPPPRGVDPTVPVPLDTICQRATAVEPADRYPSAAALADDLDRWLRGETIEARPPSLLERARVAAGRHRTLTASVATLVAAGVLAALIGVGELAAGRVAERVREDRAAERLHATDARIDERLAAGDPDEADHAFRSFVDLPEHRGTGARADAWLHRAARERTGHRLHEEETALAAAYFAAPGPDRRTTALRGLADAFDRGWRWSELAVALGSLTDDDPVARPLRVHLALAERDPLAALRWWSAGDAGPDEAYRGVLHDLTVAQPVGEDALWATRVDFDGDGDPDLLLGSKDGYAALDLPGLHPLARVARPPGSGKGRVVRFAGRILVITGWAQGPGTTVWEWAADGLHQDAVFPGITVGGLAVLDANGDGVDELYLGSVLPDRALYQLLVDPSGRWSVAHPNVATDLAGSDIDELAAADLDGDGRQELAVAAGPWGAYDLRILAGHEPAGPDGSVQLELVDRAVVGVAQQLRVIRRDDHDVLLATVANPFPNAVVFPAADHRGPAPGLYELGLDHGRLTVTARDLPRPEGISVGVGELAIGDIDGDGVDDAAFSWYPEGLPPSTAIVLAGKPGPPIVLGQTRVLAVVQLDDDPQAELLATLGYGRQLLAIGLGDTPLPQAPVQPPSPSTAAPAFQDPALADGWSRSEDLTAMGLVTDAADALTGLAAIATDPEDRTAVELRVAQLLEAAGEPLRAAEAYESAGGAAGVEGALRCRQQSHDFAGAARVATTPEARGSLRAFADVPVVDVPLSGGKLDPEWRVEDPLAMRFDPTTHELRVDTFADDGVVARYPVRCDAPWRRLTVGLAVDRTEWGSGIGVELIPRDGQVEPEAGPLRVEVGSSGGGGVYWRSVLFYDEPRHAVDDQAVADGGPGPEGQAVEIQVDLVPGAPESAPRARQRATADGRTVIDEAHKVEVGALPVGRYWVAVTGPQRPASGSVSWARARLRKIALEGCTADHADSETADEQADRALAEGRLTEVAGLSPARAVARATEDDVDATAAALRGVSPDAPALLHVVRAVPAVMAALRRAWGDRAFAVAYAAWWVPIKQHPDDAVVRQWLVQETQGLEEAHRDRKVRELLLAKAQALRADGRLAAARRDLDLAAEAGGDSPEDRLLLARVALARAGLEREAGSEDQARAAVHTALELSPTPELTADRIRGNPELAPLLGP